MWDTRPGVSSPADIKPSKTDCNLIDLECDNEVISFFGKISSTDTHLQFINCDSSSDLFSNLNTLCLSQSNS